MICDHCRKDRKKLYCRDDWRLCIGCMMRLLMKEGLVTMETESGAAAEDEVRAA